MRGGQEKRKPLLDLQISVRCISVLLSLYKIHYPPLKYDHLKGYIIRQHHWALFCLQYQIYLHSEGRLKVFQILPLYFPNKTYPVRHQALAKVCSFSSFITIYVGWNLLGKVFIKYLKLILCFGGEDQALFFLNQSMKRPRK